MTEAQVRIVMAELGSRGGKARAQRLGPEERQRISERAAAAARAKQLACAHLVTETRPVGAEERTYCRSCRRRLV